MAKHIIRLFFISLLTFLSGEMFSQSATIVNDDGSTFLLSYTGMVQAFADPNTGNTIVIYSNKYERFESTENYFTFLNNAKCNLIYFLDSNQNNRLISIPPQSIDRVVKLSNGKGRILQKTNGSSRVLSYDFSEPFDSIEARLDRCDVLAMTLVDTALVNQIVSDSLASLDFADTNFVNTKITESLDTFSAEVTTVPVQAELDTISQPLHGRSLYEAVYEIGGLWYKTFDTTPTARVEGIVVDVINANSFVVQKDGYFTQPSHGYTVGAQLFVQPNGNYSTADTSYHTPYGYALNDSLIQIGLLGTLLITEPKVDDKITWSPAIEYMIADTNLIVNYEGELFKLVGGSSKGELPDTSSNWIKLTIDNPASLSDVNAITYFIPRDSIQTKTANIGDRFIIKGDGFEYLVKSSSAPFTIDGIYVINRGDGTYAVYDKEAVESNAFSQSFSFGAESSKRIIIDTVVAVSGTIDIGNAELIFTPNGVINGADSIIASGASIIANPGQQLWDDTTVVAGTWNQEIAYEIWTSGGSSDPTVKSLSRDNALQMASQVVLDSSAYVTVIAGDGIWNIEGVLNPELLDTTIIATSLTADQSKALIDKTKELTVFYQESDTATVSKALSLPRTDTLINREGTRIKFSVKDTAAFAPYVQPHTGSQLWVGNRLANKYYLDDGETAEFTLESINDSLVWKLTNTTYQAPERWAFEDRLIPFEYYDDYKVGLLPTNGTYNHDSVTVIKKLAKVVGPENLLKRSNDIAQFPFWNTASGRVVFTTDAALGIDGKLSASKVVPNNPDPYFWFISSSGGSGGDAYNLWETNTTYTLSLWASVENGDASWVFPELGNSDLVADTFHINTTDLVRKSWTFTTNGSISPSQILQFKISPSDSLYISNVQVERSYSASPDIITGLNTIADQDTVYALLQPVNGVVSYSQSKNVSFADANEIVQKQFNYCDNLSSCYEVVANEAVTFKNGINVPRNIIFSGGGKGNDIIADLNNANADLITIGDATEPYNQGVIVRNLSILAASDARSAITYSAGLEMQFENIIIDGTPNQYFTYGYYEPLVGNQTIETSYDKLFISGADTAMYVTHQATSYLRKGSIRADCNVGVYFPSGGGLKARDFLFENIDRSAILADNSTVIHLEGVRIEDVPNGDIGDWPTFDIRTAQSFVINGYDLGPIHSFTGDTAVIKLDDVETASITNVDMLTIGNGTPVETSANTEVLYWRENFGVANDVDTSKIHDNTLFFYYDDNKQNTRIPRQVIQDATVSDSYIEDTDFDEDIKILADTVSLVGPNNLLMRSESISQFPFWNASAGSVTFTTGETDPDGGTAGSKVVYNSGTSFTYIPTSGGTAFEWQPDTWYNISWSARTYNPADNVWMYPTISATSLTTQDTFHLTDSFQRYGWSFKTDSDINAAENIFFTIAQQDSFLFAYPQLSLGKELKEYQATGATTNVDGSFIVFDGDFKVAGEANPYGGDDRYSNVIDSLFVNEQRHLWATNVLGNSQTDTIRNYKKLIFVTATTGNFISLNPSELNEQAEVLIYKNTTGQVSILGQDAGATPFLVDGSLVSDIPIGRLGNTVRLLWTGSYFAVLNRYEPYWTPAIQAVKFNGLDTIQIDTLYASGYYQVGSSDIGRVITEINLSTFVECTATLSFNILKYTPSTDSWSSITSSNIGVGSNHRDLSGLSESLSEDAIYVVETTSKSGEPNGLQIRFKIE